MAEDDKRSGLFRIIIEDGFSTLGRLIKARIDSDTKTEKALKEKKAGCKCR
jgi:hypothetical protein